MAVKSAIKEIFNYDYDSCYVEVKEMLLERDSYIYAEDSEKQMIAIYVSQSDTTPVGIFFKEIDSGYTQVEVSSQSTYAKETIAKRISNHFKKMLSQDEWKGTEDAEEE